MAVNVVQNQRQVQVSIKFLRIGEIDMMNEKYQAEILVESRWTETDKINEYDINNWKHWNPKLFIENAFEDVKQQVNYAISIENGRVIVNEIRIVKGFFWERLELHDFPVDVQELSITLSSKRNAYEIKLEADPLRLSCIDLSAKNTFIDQQKWRLYKVVEISEVPSYDLYPSQIEEVTENLLSVGQPKIVATCYCGRKAGYYFFNAFFLIFLITISALTIFSVDCKLAHSRLQITFTLLLTSVSFKWVINRSLPTFSYLTSLDKYSITCIFYLCLLCAWHSVIGRFLEKDLAENVDFWALIGFSILLFIIHAIFFIWLYFAYQKYWEINKKEKKFLNEANYKQSLNKWTEQIVEKNQI